MQMKTKATTEQELQNEKAAWPKTQAQLNEYIQSLLDLEHDYGTCVYAMSMSAVAAFNYVGSKLGATGFQASCADLDILRLTRHLDGPFIILKAEDMLYPQYDLKQKLDEAMQNWRGWLAKRAAEELEDADACDEVIKHWKQLAKYKV